MDPIEKKAAESPGVQFAKEMLERKRQTQKEIVEEYNNPDSELSKGLEKLEKRNTKRGTPVVRVNSVKKQKKKVMNTVEKAIVESPGVQLAKRMLESQRQGIKEALEEYNNKNSEVRKMIDNLIKRNEERGTPIAP